MNKNAFIPYGCQSISEEDISAVNEVLRSPLITQGPRISAFENSVAKKVKANFGVALNSATSALHVACLALELKPGEYLWTTPNSFVASANCALYCKANINFVDINPLTGLISIEDLKKKLEEAKLSKKLPKILIPVHLGGSSCDMKSIYKLSKEYGFSIIEDASHAIGGQYDDEPVGICRYSSITIFSFHPVKIITTGEGGLATTNEYSLYQRMKDLRSHGIVKEEMRLTKTNAPPWVYEQQMLGFNYRITDIQCALGLSQLNRLDKIIDERNFLLNKYKYLTKGFPLRILEVPKNVKSSVHLCIIRLDDKNPIYHRKVFEILQNLGIGVQVHYTPIHLQPFYQSLGFKKGDFPESEMHGTNAISLPLFPGLNESQQSQIINALEIAFEKAYKEN